MGYHQDVFKWGQTLNILQKGEGNNLGNVAGYKKIQKSVGDTQKKFGPLVIGWLISGFGKGVS